MYEAAAAANQANENETGEASSSDGAQKAKDEEEVIDAEFEEKDKD